jgi:hypothetical protein
LTELFSQKKKPISVNHANQLIRVGTSGVDF